MGDLREFDQICPVPDTDGKSNLLGELFSISIHLFFRFSFIGVQYKKLDFISFSLYEIFQVRKKLSLSKNRLGTTFKVDDETPMVGKCWKSKCGLSVFIWNFFSC